MSDAVTISIISGVVSLISLAMTLLIKRGQEKLHEDVNGKMQQLIEAKEAAKLAEGKEAGVKQEKLDEAETIKKLTYG